jgi:molybdate transport system substrate-binding protein
MRGRGPVARIALVGWLTLAVMSVTACLGVPPPRVPPPTKIAGTIEVSGPASLMEVLTDIANDFKQANDDVEVQLAFGADTETVGRVTTTGGAAPDIVIVEGSQPLAVLGASVSTAPVIIARNRLVIATAPGNPKHITGLRDLARAGVRVALCATSEPCGTASNAVLIGAGLTVRSPRRVNDVRAALSLVEQGSADAALVYRTDTRVAGDAVASVEFPESGANLVDYQGVVLSGAVNPAGAQAFLGYLVSQTTKDRLTGAGFQLPS